MKTVIKNNKYTGKIPLRRMVFLGIIKKLIFLLIITAHTVYAQNENKHIRQGNDNFYEENFKDAEVDYMKALEKNPDSYKGQYNLGGALYKQENFEDASKLFANIAGRDVTDDTKANAFYNLGNAFLKAQKYPEAIESYKNALRINPGDMNAKYNLEYAKKMIQEQQNQQQNKDNQQNKDEQQQENKEEQQQQQENQDQQQRDSEEQQQQNQQQQNEQQQQSQQQPQPQQISKQDAERMLEALKNDENKTLEKVKLQQVPAKSKKSEKDW